MAKDDTHFHFKRFSIRHDRATMKVGTDSVLLGTWTDVGRARSILDIGTGSGIIALMLAQRTSPETSIHGVEIDVENVEQARENVRLSPWPEKVKLFHTAIQDFKAPNRYDLIVSNPPYFKNSLQPPDERRRQARHTTQLAHEELLQCVAKLLDERGEFSVVLPHQSEQAFISLASNQHLYCTRQWSFRTRSTKKVERWLLTFTRRQETPEQGQILLYAEGNTWSEGYRSLTRDFYTIL
ncbi:MAG TPA: methyltransferase [Ohtaekwangia sp.]|nr:methyltransferase [Ohtaekwangia sp.]